MLPPAHPFSRRLPDESAESNSVAAEESNMIQELLPLEGRDVGVEPEETAHDEILRPFDPNLIRVTPWVATIDLLVKRLEQKEIDLEPDFQRKAGIWKDRAQSQLIESILLRIPLPAFYMDAADENRLVVIDGIQRLTTLQRFVIDKELRLSSLEYLSDLKGKLFSELPRSFQRRIEETQVTVYLIGEGTPPEARLNIFKRLNTGGMTLTPQEIRHAINPGPVRELLRSAATGDSFIAATTGAIDPDRMDDRECAVRFFAFVLREPSQYEADDFDAFLNEAMRAINRMTDRERERLLVRFSRALNAAKAIFDDNAFRKSYREQSRRHPINKALFEAWTVNLDALSDSELDLLVERKEEVRRAATSLLESSGDYERAVTYGTGAPRAIHCRFGSVRQLLAKVLS